MMKLTRCWQRWVLCVVTVIMVFATGQRSLAGVPLKELDGILERLEGYDCAKDSRPVNDLDTWMRQRSKEETADGQIEQRLIGFLQTKSSPAAKRYVCEHLSLMGTSASVGVLSGMLGDPATVECARYALERIPGSEASEALRAALATTDGATRIGIINSLGVRKDTGSIQVLSGLLNSDDKDVVSAAATALGQIGGGKSLKALMAAMDSSGQAVDTDMMLACLACADHCLAEADRPLRQDVYSVIYKQAKQGQLRAAALGGMVDVMGANMYGSVIAALSDADPVVRGGAVSVIRDRGDTLLIRSAAEELEALPVDTQVQLLSVLGDCGGASVKPAVVKACDSPDAAVQTEALTAMRKLGDAEDVMFLVRAAMDSRGAVQQAARLSLDRLRGATVDETIIAAIEAANAGEKAELIRSCGAREIGGAAWLVMQTAADGDRKVRVESLKSLRAICGEEHLPALIDLLLTAKGSSEQREARKTIEAVARTITPPERRADTVVTKLKTLTDPAGRCLLLRILGELGSKGGLDPLYAAMKDSNDDVRNAAIRALSDWQTPAPAEALMTIVEQPESTVKHKVLALRGYIRLAGMANNDAAKALAMYQKAMQHATRIEEKRQVIAGLSNLKTTGALSMVSGLLTDPALKAETGTAVISLSEELDETHPLEVRQSLESLLQANDNPAVQEQAKSLLDFQYITDWDIAGPYRQAGKRSSDLMEVAFGPEQADPSDAGWKPLAIQIDPQQFWQVDLTQVAGHENSVVYLKTRLYTEWGRRVHMYFGCCGNYKIFLNGDLYDEGTDETACAPGEHETRLQTSNGWNDLVIKLGHDSDNTGQWAFCCRIRAKHGVVAPGLIVSRTGK